MRVSRLGQRRTAPGGGGLRWLFGDRRAPVGKLQKGLRRDAVELGERDEIRSHRVCLAALPTEQRVDVDTDSLSRLIGGEVCHQSRIPHLLSHAITSCYNISVSLGTYYYNTFVFVNNFFVSDNGCKEVAMRRIEEARSMRGWSQAKLAEVMGTSRQQVARFEKPGADVKASVLVKVSHCCLTRTLYVIAVRGGFFLSA